MNRKERRDVWAEKDVWVLILLFAVLALFLIWAFGGLMEREEPVERAYTDFQWVRRETVAVTATGDPGAATGSNDTDRRVHGRSTRCTWITRPGSPPRRISR